MYSSTSYTDKNAKIPWDPSWTLKKERKMFSNLRQRNYVFFKSQRIFWYLWRRNQHNIYCLHLGSYVSKALEVDFVSLFLVPCLILIFERPYFFLVLKESTCLHNGNIFPDSLNESVKHLLQIDWRWSESDRNRVKSASAWPWKYISKIKHVKLF